MELFFAAKHGDVAALTQILSTSQADVNFENSNFAEIDETRPKKSMYCAECYQRVKRRKRPELYGQVWGSTFSCDWANHVRSVVVTDDSADICCCTTPSGDKCNWLICVDCFVKVTYDLKASHQMYGLQEGYTPLIAAASRGHLECVKLLLDHGADINSADPQGLTALLAATSAIHVEVVKLLLERGADINSVDQLGVCALFMACEVGDVALVEVLLGFQPDLGIREVGGATVLHAAASSGHIGIMEALLDRGLDPKETTSEGDTPMHWLPCTASAASVRLLIDRGADVNAQNERHYTPILLSTLRDNAIATSTMLKAGAVTDIQTVGWGTPLTASCLGNFHRVTEVLLAAGVDHSIGSPPLGICARRDYPLAAAVCLKHGVKGAGDALVTAADAGNPAVVKVILEHWTGEDDMEQRYLDRALAHAAKSGVLSSVKMLLEQGADATVTFGANGETAADFAKNNKIRGLIKAHLSGDTMELEEDEETVGNNRHHLLHALKKGTKKWGRSKIMIVGDGRAGKTALANSIMGEEFAHTESTIGINQMTCDVKFAEVGKEGQWDEYTKPDKELEAALAKIVAARRGGEEEEDEEGRGPIAAAKKPSGNTAGHAGDTGHEQGSASGPSKTGVGVKIGAGSVEEEASAAPTTDAVMAIDDALVMKYLANLNDNTKFVISLFDYGGQTVFNVIHHLFLTRYGVYTLVFNMEQLVSSDPAVRESCLSTISFWLNSIVVHTWNTETESMAPIVIVGTHKDIVKSAAQHEQISRILEEKFRSSVAWPWIQENEDTEEEGGQNLCFFPVDNRKSRGDTTVVKMMKLIEDIIDKSDYVHLERPLTWLQTMDRLTACGKAYLPLVEVEAIAEECDVPRSAVPSLLAFLHEMGILMWHDDVSLRDVVILDAVAYFVTPVTTIICKHLATAMDTTRHVVEVHKKCRKQYYDAWMKMVHQGIVNTDILGTLLQDCGQHLPIVMHLMVKFGLVVPLQIAEQVKGHKATSGKPLRMEEFLVPALLPALSDVPEKEQAVANYSDEYTSSCLFVFSCSGRLVDSNIMTFENTANLGFLPRGLFERLICKAVEWCRETSAVQSLQAQPLFQDAAVLVFGNQKFRMRAFHDKNCIEVNFAQGNPLAVHQRLCDQLQQILDECMKSLRFFTVLPYPAHHPQQLPGKDDSPTLSSQYLVQLDYLRAISKKHTGLHAPSGEKLLGKTEIVEQYGAWLVDDTLREEYDVFISYRWGTLDSKYTERLRDRFTIYNVNADNRAVTVFLDNKRLRDGRNFVDDFGRSLINSRIVVPVVSSDALERMRKHDPYHTDNVLMEWLMAIECFHSASSKVMRVLPMLFGKRDSSSDAIGNLYQEGALDEMPDIHPRETVRCALRLLQANGVEPRMGVSTYTVRSILMELKTILGYCTWTAESSSLVVAESAERVIISLQEVLDEGPKQAQTLSLARVWKSGPAADCGELLLTSPPRGDGTMQQPLQDISTSAATGPARRTIKEVVDEIKAQLGLGPEVKMAQVFEQALDFIGDAALAEECQAVGGLAKAEKILTALVG